MKFNQIQEKIVQQFGEESILEANETGLQPFLVVSPEFLPKICLFLRETPELYFDLLSCLSGVDLFPETKMQVVYHIYSIPLQHSIVVKVTFDRENPVVPSVSSVWRTADWHEREAFDLLGIQFAEHPDLRRMFMPEDWEGFPLRKDYVQSDEYHSIKTQ